MTVNNLYRLALFANLSIGRSASVKDVNQKFALAETFAIRTSKDRFLLTYNSQNSASFTHAGLRDQTMLSGFNLYLSLSQSCPPLC